MFHSYDQWTNRFKGTLTFQYPLLYVKGSVFSHDYVQLFCPNNINRKYFKRQMTY